MSGRARERGVALKARLQSPSIFHSAASIVPFTNSLFFTNWTPGLEIVVVKNIFTSVVVWGKVGGFWMNNHAINDTVPWEEEHEKMLRRQIGGAFGRVYLLTLWSDWHLIKFSSQYYPWIKDDNHENRGNDHQLRKLLIFQQILLLSIIGNVLRTIRRKRVLILRGKKLANRSLESSPLRKHDNRKGACTHSRKAVV